MKKTVLMLVSVAVLMLPGCASLSEGQKGDLERMAEATVAQVQLDHAEFRSEFMTAAAYLVYEIKASDVPLMSRTGGWGVVIETVADRSTYVRVEQSNLGRGWVAGAYHVLVCLEDAELLKQVRSGKWTGGHKAYVYSGRGDSAVYTLKSISLEPVE